MHEQRFYHEVIGPWVSLLSRAAENVCVAEDFSDVVSLAKLAAGAAYHFREPILRTSRQDRVSPMADPAAESIRQRLSDVVDSSKHGRLRDGKRETAFSAALAFEVNGLGQFRYLRTEVLATNERFGTFEIADTITDFMPFVASELDIRLDLSLKLPSHPFGEWAETYTTTKSGGGIASTRIRTYKTNGNNQLERFAPEEVKFRVMVAE